jgi:hypothetical protein
MRIAGGVCFHRGSSDAGNNALEGVVLKLRVAVCGMVDWRSARAHDAQTYEEREVDMAMIWRIGVMLAVSGSEVRYCLSVLASLPEVRK